MSQILHLCWHYVHQTHQRQSRRDPQGQFLMVQAVQKPVLEVFWLFASLITSVWCPSFLWVVVFLTEECSCILSELFSLNACRLWNSAHCGVLQLIKMQWNRFRQMLSILKTRTLTFTKYWEVLRDQVCWCCMDCARHVASQPFSFTFHCSHLSHRIQRVSGQQLLLTGDVVLLPPL